MNTSAVNFSGAGSGLCNRLRTIAGMVARREATGESGRLAVYWEPGWACPGHFLDVLTGTVDTLEFYPKRIDGALNCPPSPITESFRPACMPADQWSSAVSRFYNDLRPNGDIQEDVEKFWLSSGLSERTSTVGVHIRRTDFNRWWTAGWRLPSNMDIAWHLRSPRYEGAAFVIASDDEQAAGEIAGLLPSRMVVSWPKTRAETPPVNTDGRFRPFLLRDAVAELWLLSACDQVVGTGGSSYSELAIRWSKTDGVYL